MEMHALGGCPSLTSRRSPMPSQYTNNILADRPLLIAFMPVISAISGNIGLQSSAINARALALGLINPSEWRGAISHELKAGLILALVCGLLVGFVSANFPDPSHCQRSPDFFFGSAVGFSMFCSMLVASLNGAVAPLIFVRLGYDPTALAGPLETAFQRTSAATSCSSRSRRLSCAGTTGWQSVEAGEGDERGGFKLFFNNKETDNSKGGVGGRHAATSTQGF